MDLARIWETASAFVPTLLMIVGVGIFLAVARRLLDRQQARSGGPAFGKHLTMLGLTLAGLVAVIMVLPINDATRGQLLSLLGILLSAAIALSSTTIVGNAMAGVMLRAVRNFRTGDFVRVGDHFGRISERGLFHTEIQTEDRDLTTLPNIYLVSNPVTVTPSSGTLVSATVSLGYDVPRDEVEGRLIAAGEGVGLHEPFVRILELGDFSVTYRVSGLLEDVKVLLTTRARLNAAVLDALHAAGIEIVSPNFMNTRALPPEQRVIPRPTAAAEPAGDTAVEEVAFHKAEEVASSADTQAELADEIEKTRARLEKIGDDSAARAALETELAELEASAKMRGPERSGT